MEIFDRICRGCNNERPNLKDMFENDVSSTYSIFEMLKCCKINVENPKYPKKFCTLCLRKLEISYKFILQYRKSIHQFDKILTYIAQQQQVKVSTVDDGGLNQKSEEHGNILEDSIHSQNQEEFFLMDDSDAQSVNDDYLERTVLNDNNDEVNIATMKEESRIIIQNRACVEELETHVSNNKKGTEALETVVKKDNLAGSNVSNNQNDKEVKPRFRLSRTTENQERRFPCPECQISFYTSSACSLHQRIKHKRKKLKQVD